MDLQQIFERRAGPARTAALVAWLQGNFREEAAMPVLVGGAALELYTGGAYTTGDLDFVGKVPAEVAACLTEEGFARRGRHWVHKAGQVFVGFPAELLERDERSEWLVLHKRRIRIISLEDLLVDRLSAWRHWRSPVDGVNAFLLWRARRDQFEARRLARRARSAGVEAELRALRRFARRWRDTEPSAEVLERWAGGGR